MDNESFRRFEDLVEDGWHPHDGPRKYTCGWCAHEVSGFVGLSKRKEWMSVHHYPFGGMRRQETDVRVCPECWIATTFLDMDNQLPKPLTGDNLDWRDKHDDIKTVGELYNEARIALSQGAGSCAALMFRKILMHVAVEQGAKEGLRFVQYVDHLKNENVVGKPQHTLVDRIRKAGNLENHEIVRASLQDADDLLNLVTLLIRSVYFSD